MDQESYIAIDVGGTRIRGFVSINGATFTGSGVIHSENVAFDLAQSIASSIPDGLSHINSIILSLAAIPQAEKDRELIAATLLQKIEFNQLLIVSDTKAASLSGANIADLTITVGTGITAIARVDGNEFELTGQGYLIGDEASGFWIGRHGLNAALRFHDGRGIETSLLLSATEFYKKIAPQLADYLHQLPNSVAEIAAFAPLVADAAKSGDAQAKLIMTQAANEIVSIIKAAQKRAEIKNVALIGGAIPYDGYLYNEVISLSNDLRVSFVESTAEPLAGAKAIAENFSLQSEFIKINCQSISTDVWSRLYLLTSKELINQVTTSQKAAISNSVSLLVDALANKKLIHTFGTGHSHLLAEEIFYRAGGLAAIYPILDERIMLHKDVVKGSQNERLSGLADELIKKHPINKGDVVIVISNSGGNQVSIELIKLAHSLGAKVIALTSINHATNRIARSNLTEKIHQLADVVLDNSGVVGDAAIRVAGSKMAVGPTSTVVGGSILQAIIVGTVAELQKRGIDPEIFLSSNLSGGDENNAAIFAKYRSIIDLYN